MLFATLIPYSFISLSPKASTLNDTEENQDIEKIYLIEDYQANNGQSAIIRITEDQLIEKYILLAENEVIQEEILKDLSQKELQLIYDGIFAYEGLYFESGYYEQFSWYSGNILSKDKTWGKLNLYQYTNIQNIKEMEEYNTQ